MRGYKVIYLRFNTYTEEYVPYKIQFTTNTDDCDELLTNPPCYFASFLGRSDLNEQKEAIIDLFLKKYFKEEENFIWSYEQRYFIEDNDLVIIISEV